MKKSIISWIGGKAKLMWLINLLSPIDFDKSIDVFGGSGTVTLNLETPRSCSRVYNDFNSDLVNLIECAKEKPLQLMNEIGFLPLNSRREFEACKKFLRKEKFTKKDIESELEIAKRYFPPPHYEEIVKIINDNAKEYDVKRASAYYKLLKFSFNSNGKTYGGKKINLSRFGYDIWQFNRDFSDVTVENKDFEELIKQYDREHNFIYCDPPYYDAEQHYQVGFAKENHIRLHDTLKKAKGYVMVSYNKCDYIMDLYKDFYIYYTTRPNSMSRKVNQEYEELIITNYDPKNFIKLRSYQISLFGDFFSFINEKKKMYDCIHQPDEALKK